MTHLKLQDQILEHLATSPTGTVVRKHLASYFGKAAYSSIVALKKKKLITIDKYGVITKEPESRELSSPADPLSQLQAHAVESTANLIAENERLNQIISQLKEALSNV